MYIVIGMDPACFWAVFGPVGHKIIRYGIKYAQIDGNASHVAKYAFTMYHKNCDVSDGLVNQIWVFLTFKN